MSTIQHRAGEPLNKPLPTRSDRFFAAEGAWYFSTREGNPIGPFNNQFEARQGLDDFIEFMRLAKPKTRSSLCSSLAN